MLSLARGCSRRAALQQFSSAASRGLATEATTPIPTENLPEESDASNAAGQSWRKGKVPVREDHGLYAFFRRKADENLTGEDAYETVESARRDVTGRAWRASELRLKSFKDLHTLWYVTLRERNLLTTQKEEARRAGIKTGLPAQTTMAGHCTKTMARIKAVMNERRLAYEGAVRIFAEHKEDAQDIRLMKLHRSAVAQAEKKLADFQTRGRTLRKEQARKYAEAKKELEAEGVLPVAAEDASVPEAESSMPAIEKDVEAAVASTPTPSEPSKEAKKEEPAVPTGSDPKSALDTAAAGLFGESVTSKKD